MKDGYPQSAYDNPSMLDALDGRGPFTPDEVVQLHAGFTLERRRARWLRRKRRATFRRRTFRTVASSWPALWSVAILMMLIAVGLAIVTYAVLTKGAI